MLRVREVAEELGVSERVARRLCARGELPSVRVAYNSVRVREDALRQFIAERVRQGAE